MKKKKPNEDEWKSFDDDDLKDMTIGEDCNISDEWLEENKLERIK